MKNQCSNSRSCGSPGILDISKEQTKVSVPPDTPKGQVWRYGCGLPVQIAPRLGGIFASVNIECTNNYGFLNGSDIVLFSDLADITGGQTIPLVRNEYREDPLTGKRRLFLRSPMMGGFVPLKATWPDGSSHPHAGTGFGICQAHSVPLNSADEFVWWDTDRHDFLEVFQYCYDGSEFATEMQQLKTQGNEEPLIIGNSEWRIMCTGMAMAIPDGNDLLLPVIAAALNDSSVSVGLARWAYTNGAWKAVSFIPVVTNEGVDLGTRFRHERCQWCEPSIARGSDDSLWFSARPDVGGKNANLVRIWLSQDKGKTWTVVLNAPDFRNDAPVTINCAVDGTPYLVSNPFDPDFVAGPKTGRGREKLLIWPFNEKQLELEPSLVARDAEMEFGPPPESTDPHYRETWMVDHPNSATLHLGDGKWHNLLVYRLIHSPYTHSVGTFPSAQTGCYVQEVFSNGNPIPPPWRFGR